MIKSPSRENLLRTSKGQKIIAAIYLVTAHLPEGDPLRYRLRECAVALADAPFDELAELSATIISLLSAATMARIISEANSNLLETELRHYCDPFAAVAPLDGLFPQVAIDKGHFLPKRTFDTDMSFKPKKMSFNQEKKHLNNENKSKRQEKILSYITDRKSANIKDIAALFPDVSEKTIQRELSALVAAGKVTKRGNKRWSIYLAV